MESVTENPFLEDLRLLQANKSFLGREFLTWLWYRSEVQNHAFKVEGLGEFKLYLDDRLVLSCSGGAVHENALKGGTPAYAHEAHTALTSGKLVNEAKFLLQDQERQWLWSMKADDLVVRSAKLPPVSEADPELHLTGRMRLMQLLNEFVSTVFKEFVALRLSDKFVDEIRNIHEWIGTKAQHTL